MTVGLWPTVSFVGTEKNLTIRQGGLADSLGM
jgi:hypothetical protein